MNNRIAKALIIGFDDPDKVEASIVNDNLVCIMSANNTNDISDWFNINSTRLEKSLLEEGLSWCYVFETLPNAKPVIYMFLGSGVTKEAIVDELRNSMETLPEDRNIFFEFSPFSLIDEEKYDNSISEIEREFINKASDVIRVMES